jgi:hypothetical protein
MIKHIGMLIIIFIYSTQLLHAKKGKVLISCDKDSSYIYVNGEKRAITGEGYTTIELVKNEYTIKVSKQFKNGNTFSASKTVFISDDTSLKLKFTLEKEIKEWNREKEWVYKTNSSLMWQDTKEVMAKIYTWNNALKYCANLSLGQLNQWRLPKYEELSKIVEYDSVDPAIIKVFQYVDTENNYWTSTKQIDNKEKAWIIYFYNGTTYIDDIKTENSVRCVHEK